MKNLEDFMENIEDIEKEAITLKQRALNVWNWCKSNKLILGLSATICLLTPYTYYLYTNTKTITVEKEKIVYTDTPESVIKTKNFLVSNLDNYTVFKSEKTTSKKSGKELFGVWYKIEHETGESQYIANFELTDNLKYNKKEYEKFISKDKKQNLLKVK